jgi:hypothetical protein
MNMSKLGVLIVAMTIGCGAESADWGDVTIVKGGATSSSAGTAGSLAAAAGSEAVGGGDDGGSAGEAPASAGSASVVTAGSGGSGGTKSDPVGGSPGGGGSSGANTEGGSGGAHVAGSDQGGGGGSPMAGASQGGGGMGPAEVVLMKVRTQHPGPLPAFETYETVALSFRIHRVGADDYVVQELVPGGWSGEKWFRDAIPFPVPWPSDHEAAQIQSRVSDSGPAAYTLLGGAAFEKFGSYTGSSEPFPDSASRKKMHVTALRLVATHVPSSSSDSLDMTWEVIGSLDP